MSVSKKLTTEIGGIALLVVIIVVYTIVLNKFKEVSGGVCSGAYPTYNVSTATCINSTGGSIAQGTLGTSIDTATGAIDEPIAWITIIVIIIVVAWLMVYLKGKKGKGI